MADEMLLDFTDALQQITEAKGRFNRDGVTHLQNCLQDMQLIAISVLRKHGIQPRRDDDPIEGEPVPFKEFERDADAGDAINEIRKDLAKIVSG